MRHAFQVFIDHLSESVDEQDLHNVLANLAMAFDLPCFAYLRMPSQSGEEADIISTYPHTWTSHYQHRHYEQLDPVIGYALTESESFEWGPGFSPRRISNAQEELLDRAARFGIRYGSTIPIRGARAQGAALTFASDERSRPFRRCIEKKAQVFQLLALVFHAKASRLVRGDRIVAGALLSPRQLQCLQWAARGKSAVDIAPILDISPRTVTFHLENAKAKLECAYHLPGRSAPSLFQTFQFLSCRWKGPVQLYRLSWLR